jgi:hypothetical protein
MNRKGKWVGTYAYLCRLFERLLYITTVEDFEALLPFSAFNVATP